jgi:hypothetical protein
MTYTDDMAAAAPGTPGSPWEQCDHCQAPLDERQRYCVACGARRAQADDPVARYFVTAARRARANAVAPAATPAAARSGRGAQTALILALLPLTAGIGVVVGRSANGNEELLAQALKAQKAPIVNVGSGSGSATAGDDSGSGKRKKDKSADGADGKVIAKTEYGTARQLTGAKVTKEQLDESKQALDKIVNSKGKEYVESQRGLPDQIVIP